MAYVSGMKFFDAHCHLQSPEIFPTLGKILERAAEAGVVGMAVCGTSPDDWEKVLQLAEQFPQVTPMIGCHPWFVSDSWSGEFQTLGKLLREHPEAGIGETGLDSQKRFTNRAE
jgi:TatD DNase family protein